MGIKGKACMLVGAFAASASLPWLVPHMGFLALVCFVPLLMLEQMAFEGELKRFFLWQYSAFLLWNALTTYWVCNATVGGGVFACVANAMFSAVIFQVYHFSRKVLKGRNSSLFLLVGLWIAWEKLFFSTQVSWPWLTLGNAFAASTSMIQWYEYTGTLGGSLWILLSGILLFRFLEYKTPARLLSWAVAVAAPLIVSQVMYFTYDGSSDKSIDVVIAQPDFDPYEKFESLTQSQQDAVLLSQFKSSGRDSVLFIGPETFSSKVNSTNARMVSFLSAYAPCSSVLYGASTYDFYDTPVSPNCRRMSDGTYYLSRNSAVMTDTSSRVEMFHKNKLVVGVESTPWPSVLTKLDDLLGGVMGRCEGQGEVSLLHFGDVPLGCAICYESIYGDYCRDYVLSGAQVMTVITNDAWWGDTPGYRQHLSYSSLRAIELRRDIARCANTGISAIINSRGDIVKKSDWWKREVLEGTVALRTSQTFFVRNGDIVGRVCSFLAALMLALLAVSWIKKKQEI